MNIKKSFDSVANNIANAGINAQRGINSFVAKGPKPYVTNRRGAFSAEFTDTVTKFARGGTSIPGKLDGLAAKLPAGPTSGKVTGSLRNAAFNVASLAIAGLKAGMGAPAALLGVAVGLGKGAKAFVTYQAPTQVLINEYKEVWGLLNDGPAPKNLLATHKAQQGEALAA